jgi:hypothetical protein
LPLTALLARRSSESQLVDVSVELDLNELCFGMLTSTIKCDKMYEKKAQEVMGRKGATKRGL